MTMRVKKKNFSSFTYAEAFKQKFSKVLSISRSGRVQPYLTRKRVDMWTI